MFAERRLLFLGLMLVVAGCVACFIPQGGPLYDDNATYELSRAKNGKWERTAVSGRDLNLQTAAQPENKFLGKIMVGAGIVALGCHGWVNRRRTQ